MLSAPRRQTSPSARPRSGETRAPGQVPSVWVVVEALRVSAEPEELPPQVLEEQQPVWRVPASRAPASPGFQGSGSGFGSRQPLTLIQFNIETGRKAVRSVRNGAPTKEAVLEHTL